MNRTNKSFIMMVTCSCLMIQLVGVPKVNSETADIYLLNGQNDKILKLDNEGNLTTVLTAPTGSSFSGLAADIDNNFYTIEVTDKDARVLKNGKEIKKLADKATSIIVNAAGDEIHLIDGPNGKIRKFTRYKNLTKVPSAPGASEISQFNGLGLDVGEDFYTLEIRDNFTRILKNGEEIKSLEGTINELAVGPGSFVDSDRDGIPNEIDPFPTDPEGTIEFVESEVRDLSDFIMALATTVIEAKNEKAALSQKGKMSRNAKAAANAVAAGKIQKAIGQLDNLLKKVDGDPKPVDWLIHYSEEKELLAAKIMDMIRLLKLM